MKGIRQCFFKFKKLLPIIMLGMIGMNSASASSVPATASSATKPVVPTTRASSSFTDALSKNGNWKISINASGNMRIFQQNAFKPSPPLTGGPYEMSMFYQRGSGGGSFWEARFKDTSGNYLSYITNATGTNLFTSSNTMRPTQGDPFIQKRSAAVTGVGAIETTTFLEPVNNEKMLIIGFTIKNQSAQDVVVDIRMFMDTMMDIDNAAIYYGNDRVPVLLTPTQNSFIARAVIGQQGQSSTGSWIQNPMPAPGAQYIIYYRDTPNITNADYWWVGNWNSSNGSGNATHFWYGYQTGVDSMGYPTNLAIGEMNQTWANDQSTLNYPGGNPVFDTAANLWYTDKPLAAGEEITVKFAVGMSIQNNPPVLETLLPDKPVMINTIKDNTTSMNISGTWYDNDSPYVDIYGVVDGGAPVMYDGGSLNNDAPRYSGPQTGITGPDNRPFSADYDLSSYNDAEWHIVDYYIEDPSQLVSNQKSVKFILYALEPITKGYDYVDGSYTQATLKGSINRASLPASAKIVEVGLVYAVSDGNLPPNSLLDHSNGRGIVSTDWDGNIGSTFSGMAYGLDPALTYHYVSYAKVEWTDPITGEKFYEYVYSEIQPMSTFRLPPDEPTPSPTGSVLNPATESGQSDTIGTDGGVNFGGSGDSNSYVGGNSVQFAAGPAPYTASVTMQPKTTKAPDKIADETVDDGTEDIPVTGYKSKLIIIAVIGIVGAIGVAINRKKNKNNS